MKQFIFYSPSAQQLIERFNTLAERLSEMSIADPGFIDAQAKAMECHEEVRLLLEQVRGKKGQYYFSVPRVTIVCQQQENKYVFAASRCSPLDAFIKKQGREKCIERINKEKYLLEVATKDVPTEKFTEWFISNAKNLVNQVILDTTLLAKFK